MLERSALSSVLGLPGYAAIAIALGFTALGVFIDLSRINGLGAVFKGCYFAGCVLAVCWVKRRALFGPMVQPPLLLAVAVPSVVLISRAWAVGPGGAADHLLSVGAPLLNGFPTMAVTTAFAVGIGAIRYVVQRPLEPEERPRPTGGPSAQRPTGRPGHDPSGDHSGYVGRPSDDRSGYVGRPSGDRIGDVGRPGGGGSKEGPRKERRRDARRPAGERSAERTRPLRAGSASATSSGRSDPGESSTARRPDPPSPPGVPDPPWRRVSDQG